MKIIKGNSSINGDNFHYAIVDKYDGGYDLEINGFFDNLNNAKEAFEIIKNKFSHIDVVNDNYDFYSDIIFNDDIDWI